MDLRLATLKQSLSIDQEAEFASEKVCKIWRNQ